MKKFLVFLVSLVVVVCVGLTTYYFMRNNEIISVKTKEIYCNAGDTISLNSLGISIKKANVSKKTKFNYNAGGEDVTKYIKFDEESSSFIVSQENAGEVTLVIRTTNKKYPDFTINVHIGNGTQENPYFIFNQRDLARIGSTYRLDSHFKLMGNITLTADFNPIGFNSATQTWDGFNGNFDGQGYTIKNLSLVERDVKNAGFFSTLGANAKVSNLVLENATITGAYDNVGVLAGVINGNIEKVAVKNANITNSNITAYNNIGSIAGKLTGGIKLSYAENVTINANGTDEQELNYTIVGGLIGELNQANIQACYANDVELNISKSKSFASGGLVGKFYISEEKGSIQQSYANVTCDDNTFGSFVGQILGGESFDLEKANMLRYLIGNFAVVNNAETTSSITDAMLVHGAVGGLFVNESYAGRSAFYDKESALYLIRGYASAGEVVITNEFVFYAIDMNTITNWDTEYVWNVEGNSLPTLRMGSIYPTVPSGEYFLRNLAQKDLGNKETFVSTFSSNVNNQKIKLLEDVDLTAGWTPVSVTNSTVDGNGKTIRLNLNNAVNSNLGLFTILDNVTIKNLNIIVTGVNANATYAGALAGIIKSSDANATSLIENVTITFEDNFKTSTIYHFGGIAGQIENTVVDNCSVEGLKINAESKITGVGAIASYSTKSIIKNSTVSNISLIGNTAIAGLVATNDSAIINISGDVALTYNSNTEDAIIGGVTANNFGSIDNVDLIVNINIKNAGELTRVGGVSAINNGSISNVNITGENIAVNVTSNKEIQIGGVVATNFGGGNITSVLNAIKNIGTYNVNANQTVGGVAQINEGTISKVVLTSNLYGNTVSGVVAEMSTLTATIDQVVVGNYDASNKTLTQNEIKADKYVAGVVVDFKAGTITNVQTSSKLVGETNSTRSSLVALIFANGATLQNATIDSSFSGYGERYRETWTDFNAYTNKAEFGLSDDTKKGDERFNVYKYDSYHGKMQSVVINSANSGVSAAKAAMGSAFAFTKDYQDTSESSFIKVVNGFNDVTQFQGSFTFVCSTSVLGIKHEATKTLNFKIGNVWESNNGISLMFLNDIYA